MTRDEIRQYVRDHPIDWPALNPAQRLRLAVLLRPDLPVGIVRPAERTTSDDREAEAA